MNDSIKYAYPIYTNAARDGFDYEAKGYDNSKYLMTNRFDDEKLPEDPMYASTESRYATELVNVDVTTTDSLSLTVDFSKATAIGDAGFIEKDATIYIIDGSVKKALAVCTNEGEWFSKGKKIALSDGSTYVTVDTFNYDSKTKTATVTLKYVDKDGASVSTPTVKFSAVGRYNSERDLTGKYLGEVEIGIKTYHFRPRPITLGVTWTKLTELVLDTSFGISAEEILLDSASQEIKKSLDYQAVAYAKSIQSAYAPENFVEFDAEGGKNGGNDDSYWHTAQIVNQAIGHVSDNMYDSFGRGGVSAIVGGSRFCRYLELNEGWTTKGKQTMIGGYKAGELNGLPVFAVPEQVIANNEALTTWKNDTVENDVSIAIGTILPFFSTGALQRKNLYVEQSIARFEDTQALQPKYLGKVVINNIR